MATPTEIKDRLVALWALVDGITTSVDDYPNDDLPFEDAELPAVVTRLVSTQLGPVVVTRTELARGLIQERWQIPAVIHVARIENADVLAPNTTEMELCEPFLTEPALFFLDRQRLGDHETALPDLVTDSDPLANTGIVKIERPGASYWGVVCNHSIIN